jgi:hypothetical protein
MRTGKDNNGGTKMTREDIKAEIASIQDAGRRMNALQNEGADGYDHTDNVRLIELADMLVKMDRDEWTYDVTVARRAAWNAELKRQGSSATLVSMRDAMGFGLDDLKAAKRKHNIQ